MYNLINKANNLVMIQKYLRKKKKYYLKFSHEFFFFF